MLSRVTFGRARRSRRRALLNPQVTVDVHYSIRKPHQGERVATVFGRGWTTVPHVTQAAAEKFLKYGAKLSRAARVLLVDVDAAVLEPRTSGSSKKKR
ncbi:MAG: hypothetical protein QM784_28830 [Polyangiaceae bacterium]